MLKIRLQRVGRKNAPSFRVVLAEHTSPPQGKFIEILGFYNPRNKEKKFKKERIEHWVSKGAQISPTVYNLLIDEKILTGIKLKAWRPKKSKKIEEKPVETSRVEDKAEDKLEINQPETDKREEPEEEIKEVKSPEKETKSVEEAETKEELKKEAGEEERVEEKNHKEIKEETKEKGKEEAEGVDKKSK